MSLGTGRQRTPRFRAAKKKTAREPEPAGRRTAIARTRIGSNTNWRSAPISNQSFTPHGVMTGLEGEPEPDLADALVGLLEIARERGRLHEGRVQCRARVDRARGREGARVLRVEQV